MGVPKFYRWISERYPCLSEVIREFQIPEFDNFYLDMNGIIHIYSHPEDDNPHFRISEEDIFICIFQYIEMIKPSKVFFMAVDGVAPRAKMNQQRGRRFRSAREAETLIQEATDRGEVLPSEKRFDSNCITPGTEFMVKLQKQLQYFVVQKISTDPLWQGVKVFLSGHETPGEGEHKIMDYIRYTRSQPYYDPNTRHCVYGLDADLILLGLTSHEPHFSLLREEVRFGGRKDKSRRPATPKETTFLLLHLSLMREYLGFEFGDLKHKLSFPFDLERVIDDWILMSFLVGNDFIPHLPHLHIHHDGLPLLWQTYMQVLPTLDGYLTNGGKLHLARFEKYITTLSKLDFEKFQETTVDAKWLAAKSSRGRPIRVEEAFSILRESSKKGDSKFRNIEEFKQKNYEYEKDACITDNTDVSKRGVTNNSQVSFNCDESEDRSFMEFKKEYYKTKLGYSEVTPGVLREQAYTYVCALQWNLLYYFEGCKSWGWFYPHHYAPFMSDLVNIKDLDIRLEMGTPFLPFQQLMAVLPAASRDLLPVPYQELMTQEFSPVKKYYPEDFDTDLNGKLHDWEAVVLIPFIEENKLLSAMFSMQHRLTAEEKSRNKHGPCLMFSYYQKCLGKYPSTIPRLPDVHSNRAICTYVPIDAFHISSADLKKGMLANNKHDVYFPGFPTLRHIRHRAELKKDGVRVFQFNSKSDNMIIQIIDECEQDLKSIATEILGTTLLVDWPHLFEAKVLEVSDESTKYFISNRTEGTIKCEKLEEHNQKVWHREVNGIGEKYHSRRGIEIGPTFAMVHACPMTGRRYVAGSHGMITLEKQFSEHTTPYALQATVRDVTTEEPGYCQFKTIDELFTINTPIAILGWPHYGCHGEVLGIDKDTSTVNVLISIPIEPNLERIVHNQKAYKKKYMPAYLASRRIGISAHFLARITGTVYVIRGTRENGGEQKVNIGLNLKFSRRNEEMPGYTKRTEDGWLYSDKTIDTVSKYLECFPRLWEIVSTQEHTGNDVFFESEVFFNQEYGLQDVIDFLKSLPCQNIKTIKVGSDVLDEGIVQAIAMEVQRLQELNKTVKKIKLPVKPQFLFKPTPSVSNIIPDPEAEYHLFDRVVNIRQGLPVPFGLRGTLVGIHPGEKECDTVYDIIFDEDFSNGIELCSVPCRGYRLNINDMMNLTHGERKNSRRIASPFVPHMSYQANRNYNQSSKNAYSDMVQSNAHVNDRHLTARTQGSADHDDTFHLNNFHDGITPQFVTPKMFSRQQSNPKFPNDKTSNQGERSMKLAGSEFEDMWKELKQYKTGDQGGIFSLRPGGNKFNDCSLTHAAQALGKLPNPINVSNTSTAQTDSFSDIHGLSQQPSAATSGGVGGSSTSGVSSSSGSSNFPSGTWVPSARSTSSSGSSFISNNNNTTNNNDDNNSSIPTSSNLTRLTLSSLFKHAEKTDQKSLTDTLGGLNLSDSSQTVKLAEPHTTSAGNAEDGTAALKQMLHIGESGGSQSRGWYENVELTSKSDSRITMQQPPPPQQQQQQPQQIQQQQQQPQSLPSAIIPSSPSATLQNLNKSANLGTMFTRQVTVEELFEGAMDQSVSQGNQQPQIRSLPLPNPPKHHPASAGYSHVGAANFPPLQPRTPSIPNATTTAYKQHQQLQQRHRAGPPPGFPKNQIQKNLSSKVGVCRNTLAELHNICCHYGLGSPKYDFSGNKNHITARISLSNGTRLQGTVCSSREEAVESAARIALLQLSAQSMMLPYQLIPHHGMMSAAQLGQLPQQFSSPNSAFSPVVPRGPTPGWGIVAPHQHLQKVNWYSAQTSGVTSSVAGGGGGVPYQSTSGNQQFGTKQQQILSNPAVSTSLMPSQVQTLATSLSGLVANGSVNSAEKTKKHTQQTKILFNQGRENAVLTPAGGAGKTSIAPDQPNKDSEYRAPDSGPASTAAIAASICPSKNDTTSTTTGVVVIVKSNVDPPDEVEEEGKVVEQMDNTTTTNNSSNSNSIKSRLKKKRSRIAANFCTSPSSSNTTN